MDAQQQLIEKYHEKMESFTIETFRSLSDKTFLYKDQQGNCFELTLREINEGTHNLDMFDSFSLIFSSDKSVLFQQGYYELDHKELEGLALCLIPVSPSSEEVNCYQVHFSRKKAGEKIEKEEAVKQVVISPV